MLGDRTRVIPISGIERWLAAAGLPRVKHNFAAAMLQYFNGRDSNFAKQSVHEAGQHKLDAGLYRRKPSLLPPSTGITAPVVRLLRWSLASQQIASAQSSGVTTVPRSERFA